MQHIGIDVRMARHSGIGRYIRGFVSALESRSAHRKYTLVGSEESKNDFSPELRFVSTGIPIYSMREQIILPSLARFADCLHVPHYNAPFFWKQKLVVTIHDLIHLHFSDHLASPFARFYAQAMLPQITKRADAIIAVSEYTKKDLVETLGISPHKVTVIHHGINREFIASEQIRQNSSEKHDPYFLYVGLIKAHKNVGILLEAFRKLKQKLNLPALKLYLIGAADRKQAVVRKWLEEIDGDTSVVLMNGLGDGELKNFYQNAAALVFPSLCEGFGFPLLEAMASRTPIIASRAASIPEVLGDTAGLYFDPHSVAELQNCMEKILENTDLRAQLIQEGLKRLVLFDWKATGKKTEQVYESVLGTTR